MKSIFTAVLFVLMFAVIANAQDPRRGRGPGLERGQRQDARSPNVERHRSVEIYRHPHARPPHAMPPHVRPPVYMPPRYIPMPYYYPVPILPRQPYYYPYYLYPRHRGGVSIGGVSVYW